MTRYEVRCRGYGNKNYLVGTYPTEAQAEAKVEALATHHARDPRTCGGPHVIVPIPNPQETP